MRWNNGCAPDNNDSFPNMDVSPDFAEEEFYHPLLNDMREKSLEICSVVKKKEKLNKMTVKVLNKDKLKSKIDIHWKSHFGVDDNCKPEWRILYKPPLTKMTGDLQWKLLHGTVAVNAFVSIINQSVEKKCLFCKNIETILQYYYFLKFFCTIID